jgi:predicted transcriptional regulator
MNEEDFDRVYELREKIEEAITKLVNKALENEKRDVENLVRVQLTENYRFWK